MEQLLILLCGSLSYQEITDLLQEHLTAYRLAPNEDSKKQLIFHCMMLLTKYKIDAYGGDAMETIDQFEKYKEITNLFKNRTS